MASGFRSAAMLGVVLCASTVLSCRAVLGIEDTRVDENSCILVAQRVFFVDHPVSDTTVKVGVVSRSRLVELARAINATLDPARGHAVAEIVDCDDEPAEFAAADFEPSGAGVTSFVPQGDTFVLGTDSSVEGAVGALNLDTAALEVNAYPDAIGVESSRGMIVTRAEEMSRIRLVPNSAVSTPAPSGHAEWACVGEVPPPVVSDETITLTVEVEASSNFVPSGVPVAGVTVAVCLEPAAACDAGAPGEGQSAVTDASGRAQLVVAAGTAGFEGQLLIFGELPGCRE